MAGKSTHRWAFKRAIRAGAYSWHSSSKAIERLKSARKEILSVARSEPVTAAEGVVALAQRIWPAFEHIDTSSGALGGAVAKTLEDLVPVLIEAPADEKTRAKWLEQLREAILDDGVDYLAPIADRFGEIAAYPALMNDHADRELDLIRSVWSDHERFDHVPSAIMTLSCLLESGRYDELLELLSLKRSLLWFDASFGAEALLRQGRETEALEYAEAQLQKGLRYGGAHDIARFCERILVSQGDAETAYRRFALPMAVGNTYLAIWRDLVKRYPDRDKRMILEDLIATHGAKGKWFAAAKTAGFFDIALECAAQSDASPATLIRASRDLRAKKPAFAAQVGLHAIRHLVEGRGYEPKPADIDQALTHLLAAADDVDQRGWVLGEAGRIANSIQSPGLMVERLRRNLADLAE